MTRKIGEIFKDGENTYIVVQTDKKYPMKCYNCDYFHYSQIICGGNLRITGDCILNYRDDNNSVIFKKIINL